MTNTRKLLPPLALVGALALVPVTASSFAAADTANYQELEKFMSVYERVKANYVERVDDATLIKGAIDNLTVKLVEEFIVVAVVCAVFLFHLRSALVAIVTLPIGILASFIIMHYQGVNANIMSLGGIAIAIGAMVDAAVVMIENAHKKLEGKDVSGEERWRLIAQAAAQPGGQAGKAG